MFYYRITVVRNPDDTGGRRTYVDEHREFLDAGDLGEHLGALFADRKTHRVDVTRINQQTFIAATRPGE